MGNGTKQHRSKIYKLLTVSFNYLIDNSGINAQAKQTYIVCNYKQQQERTTRTTNVFNMRTFKFGSDILKIHVFG